MGENRETATGQHENGIRPKRAIYSGRLGYLWFSFCAFLLVLGAATAVADQEDPQSPLPVSREIGEAIDNGTAHPNEPALTDPSAAEGIATQGLGREEALELMQGVFDPELRSPASVFSELHVEKFLSPNVAIVPSPASQPAENQTSNPEPGTLVPTSSTQESALLESTFPLRTESASGAEEAIDLTLERNEGELQPANPLVEVGVPAELGDGIELPEAGVTVRLNGAPQERSPSTVDNTVAFYPNVAQDTDLAVAPMPTGVETLSMLRSPSSPTSETFELNLPQGATLSEDGLGGAEATRGSEALFKVLAPTAIDADGAEVPCSMEVSGMSIKLKVDPSQEAVYPILLDPVIQTYGWQAGSNKTGIASSSGQEQWSFEQTTSAYKPSSEVTVSEAYLPAIGTPGLFIHSGEAGTVSAGSQTAWSYTVPRYYKDWSYWGEPPTSFIKHATLSGLVFSDVNHTLASPALWAGIWDYHMSNWVSVLSWSGVGGSLASTNYEFPNPAPDEYAKSVAVLLHSTEAGANPARSVYVGGATVELGDTAAPTGTVSSEKVWYSAGANGKLEYDLSDSGLGVQSLKVTHDSLHPSETPPWKVEFGCTGAAGNPCPREAWTGNVNYPLLIVPGVMSPGTHELTVQATDPVGNSSSAIVNVNVDNSAPEVRLTGTLTEQAKLGSALPTYGLNLWASDGWRGPQESGLRSIVIKVDGSVKEEFALNCKTQCEASRTWSMESSKFSTGPHVVEVVTTDMAGNATSEHFSIELHPTPPPTLALTGSSTEQSTLGVTRPRYGLTTIASAASQEETPATNAPMFISSFGSSGIGNGQFTRSGAEAVDSSGNLWVADTGRLEEFNAKGEFLRTAASRGSGNGQLGEAPSAIAIDPQGNVLVADPGNSRIEKFNSKGEYLSQFGSKGTATGKFEYPEGVAVDSKSNVWVADTRNARLQEFNEKGEFVKAIGTKGTGVGQLYEPASISVGTNGLLWVSDWHNNRVSVFSESGEYLREFGTEGANAGQFMHPDAIRADGKGQVWVVDTGNYRVEEFDENGEYLNQFGSKGAGPGQFNPSRPAGIATDTQGDIWVTDPPQKRVEKWRTVGPWFERSVGTSGTGNGQFSKPAGIAVDVHGNLWVADSGNNRIVKLNEKGEYLSKLGSKGSANGQLLEPAAVAIDAKGNLWVADAGNNRIEEFSESGSYLAKVGSKGTGNGQFEHPESVAIDSKGNIWVADTRNGRLEELNEKGEFLKVVGSKGTGAEQLGEPVAISVGPYGMWVADATNNRVEWYIEGVHLLNVGTEGTAHGKFRHPPALAVDTSGRIWVADSGNSRIQELSSGGKFINQIGAKGSNPGQIATGGPLGLATDSQGNLWAADSGNNRLEEWHETTAESQIKTVVTVDGKTVDTAEGACVNEACGIAHDLMLESSLYSPGKHTVVVTATDGVGRATTKSLSVEVQRDQNAPEVELEGALPEAPGGWLEQKPAAVTANASDKNGYGVTSVELRVDAKVIASSTANCTLGGCPLSLSQSVNLAEFSGGKHTAEIIATDGAGNTTTKRWTLNVDPSGQISPSEAAKTLEAADPEAVEQAPSGEINGQLVDPTLEPLKAGGLELAGAEAAGSVANNPGNGFTLEGTVAGEPIENPEAPISAVPTEIKAGASEAMNVNGGAAAVYANAHSGADLAVRPQPYGLETIVMIREPSAPTTYAWEVSTLGGGTLQPTEEGGAQLVTSKPIVDAETNEVVAGGQVAAVMAPPEAVDAVGNLVPAKVSLVSNVVKISVEASAKTVYPIIVSPPWTSTEAAMNSASEISGEDDAYMSSAPPPDNNACHLKVIRAKNGGAPYTIYGTAENICLPGVGITYQDVNACLEVHVHLKGGGEKWVAADCRNHYAYFALHQEVFPRAECHGTNAWRTQGTGTAVLDGVLFGTGAKYSEPKLLQCKGP